MAFYKAEQYGESESILDSAVGLITKTKQATKAMADEAGVIKAGTLFSTSEDTYSVVSETASQNPSEKGWYVLKDGVYEKTTDSSPQGGTTYYTKATTATYDGVVFEDYDMEDYDALPIAVVVQGRVKADKVSEEALAQRETFAKQGLYLV